VSGSKCRMKLDRLVGADLSAPVGCSAIPMKKQKNHRPDLLRLDVNTILSEKK
jgi:hypothetical protein